MMWSGSMTATTYVGEWSFESEAEYRSGDFSLERTR